MTVEHGEWVVETGSQGIDETGHDIPVLTGQQMRQSALEGAEQEPDVFAGVEPMVQHAMLPFVLEVVGSTPVLLRRVPGDHPAWVSSLHPVCLEQGRQTTANP
ncbi:MAG TPA: hypothetical protein VH540_08940 [Ktedonobacterales bacterium]